MKLTKRTVDAFKPSDKEQLVWDDELPGLCLRVKSSGVRSYIIQYRNRQGRSRRLTLGRHGVLTAEQARREARTHLAEASKGHDPAEERAADRKAPTMRDLATDYLSRHAEVHKRAASVRKDRAMLNRYILPRLGNRKVEGVSRRDVESLHQSLKDAPYQANRVLALVSKMMNLAVRWGWRPENPVRGVERFQEHKRERWLSIEELRRLIDVLDRHPNRRAANAIRLLLLTGARRGEVLAATWGEFDLERGVWTKPSHHTKQKKKRARPSKRPSARPARRFEKER